MSDIRARLLAILKEPARFKVISGSVFMFDVHDTQTGENIPQEFIGDANALCADLNARHRLKRLCEEIAG